MTIQNAKIYGKQVNPDDYHSYGAEKDIKGSKNFIMSRSDLMEFDHCPHRWVSGFEKKRTDALSYGQMIDCYMLDRDRFDDAFIVRPDTYENDKGEIKKWNNNSNTCRAWNAETLKSGMGIISEADLKTCNDAKESLMQDSIIKSFIESSDKQVMIVAEWKDELGIIVPLKCLIDLVPREGQYLGDLKTCRTAANSTWAREIYNYGYHVQAAFYVDMYYAATGEARDGFVHIIQENYPPYEPGRRLLSEEFIEMGQAIYKNALKNYCSCINHNNWTGYDNDPNKQIDGFTIVDPELWMIEKQG